MRLKQVVQIEENIKSTSAPIKHVPEWMYFMPLYHSSTTLLIQDITTNSGDNARTHGLTSQHFCWEKEDCYTRKVTAEHVCWKQLDQFQHCRSITRDRWMQIETTTYSRLRNKGLYVTVIIT